MNMNMNLKTTAMQKTICKNNYWKMMLSLANKC